MAKLQCLKVSRHNTPVKTVKLILLLICRGRRRRGGGGGGGGVMHEHMSYRLNMLLVIGLPLSAFFLFGRLGLKLGTK